MDAARATSSARLGRRAHRAGRAPRPRAAPATGAAGDCAPDRARGRRDHRRRQTGGLGRSSGRRQPRRHARQRARSITRPRSPASLAPASSIVSTRIRRAAGRRQDARRRNRSRAPARRAHGEARVPRARPRRVARGGEIDAPIGRHPTARTRWRSPRVASPHAPAIGSSSALPSDAARRPPRHRADAPDPGPHARHRPPARRRPDLWVTDDSRDGSRGPSRAGGETQHPAAAALAAFPRAGAARGAARVRPSRDWRRLRVAASCPRTCASSRPAAR